MAERLVIRISPSPRQPDVLKVQDVFAQVVDLFDMAAESEADVEGLVIWRLVAARMNSPFEVVAEAIPSKPNVDISDIARNQKDEFIRNLESLRKGEIPEIWAGRKLRRVVTRVLSRNQNGIGEMDVYTDEQNRESAFVSVHPNESMRVLQAIAEPDVVAIPRPKVQMGSLEGRLIKVSKYRSKPALRIRERKTGLDLWGIVEAGHAAQVANAADFNDVWSGRRILVSGRIEYNARGQVDRVYVRDMNLIDASRIGIEDIRDTDFTGGLSPSEYLDKLRDGDLG
jgi:hypothetical protein